jgi:hypothetical protein
MFSECQNI